MSSSGVYNNVASRERGVKATGIISMGADLVSVLESETEYSALRSEVIFDMVTGDMG